MVIATEADNDSALDHNSSLMDMGLDSLGSVELSRSLEIRFEVELSSTLVFNKPSIRDLSEYIYNLVSLDGEVNDDEVGFFLKNKDPVSEFQMTDKNNVICIPSFVDGGGIVKVKYRPVALFESVQETHSSKHRKKKPRVLFFHGSYTNPDISQSLLTIKNWGNLFDFVIPGAPYQDS
eukprot:CAMPEP_0197258892 /NCGR_PEP_ID=MMETSP1429-20130617/83236_1 /TAXON_ID=49237 /ORGANISM="Chaetoceros  sp., Strain UNC1202" /LENGTH=177 /DNA_ID=CAMNT_0042723081 /DNA_START=930 /DNA_END=1460 /DNA_ORIENTATION=-